MTPPSLAGGAAMGARLLVLSLFPGIGLLDRAFEEEGFCVVRGPDVLWGGDVRAFHPPAGIFAGVIGGPPCQAFSSMRHLLAAQGHTPRFGNMIPEFERVVTEAEPGWFLMENVPDAPTPIVDGYEAHSQLIRDKWVGGLTPRMFSFGTREGMRLDIEWSALMAPESEMGLTAMAGHAPVGRQSVLSGGRAVPVRIGGSGKVKRSILSSGAGAHGGGRGEGFEGGKLPGAQHQSIEDACELQGLPRDFTDHMPFTQHGKRSAIGNGVPLAMGRAVAKAVLASQAGGAA